MSYRVQINNFGRYRGRETGLTASFELPARGSVLVVGPNSQGKSIGFYGVLAWGLFGSDGLKPDPVAGRTGSVTLRTETYLIERFRKSSKGSLGLAWCRRDSEPVDYESPSKAQEALEVELGCDAERWKAVSLFHADTASSVFTGATDAGRKALIESLIPGFAGFDSALEKVRREDVPINNADIQRRKQQLALRDQETAALTASRATALSQLERLVGEVGSVETYRANQLRLDQLEKLPLQLRQSIVTIEEEISRVHRGGSLLANQTEESTARGQLRDAKQLQGVGGVGPTCPTCLQEVPASHREALTKQGQELHRKAQEVLDLIESRRNEAARLQAAQIESLSGQRRKIQGDMDQAERMIRRLASDIRAYEALDQQRAHLQRTVTETDARLATLVAERDQLEGLARSLAEEAEILRHTESILGLRGFRAHLTGRFLGALEELANVELATLLPGVQLEIRPYSETKAGDVRQKIGLSLTGAYQGEVEQLSRGRRRLVDFSIWLGLRTLARASGPIPGWLTIDESLDSLDEQGIAAVARRLAVVSETELVVVISHSPAVGRGLKFTQQWEVDSEGIHRVR